MSKTTVTDALFMANVTAKTAAVQNMTKLAADGNSFSKAMNEATEKPDGQGRADGNAGGEGVRKSKTIVDKPAGKVQDMDGKSRTKGAKDQEAGNGISDDVKEALVSEVTEKGFKIGNAITEKFDASDEELSEAMEVLGLTGVDLLDPANLRNLIMEVTETGDSLELLTNVELYEGMKEIVSIADEMVGEIKDTLSLDDEEFVNAMDEVLKAADDRDINELKEEKPEFKLEDLRGSADKRDIPKDIPRDRDADIKDDAGYDPRPGNDPKIRVTVERGDDVFRNSKAAEDDHGLNELNDNAKAGESIIKEPAKLSGENEHFAEKKHPDDEQQIQFQQVQTSTNTVGDIVETIRTYTSASADSQNIVDQVVQQIRVTVSQDETSMEMQLHPASLGTVRMQLTAQNGVVTAQLTVQDEQVRSILESQLMKLQETFEAQGQRVEAIEVSVAGYDLDRSLSGEANGQDDKDNRGQKSGRVRRALNLNDPGSLDDLTEEEEIAASMLEANGNTVEYTA